jgi:hypothetical protein
MNVEDIIVTGGDVSVPYRVLGGVSARVQAATVFNGKRAMEEVDAKLRHEVLMKGASAVINVTYTRGVQLPRGRHSRHTARRS